MGCIRGNNQTDKDKGVNFMDEKIANKIMGCFFILISALLYITDQISKKIYLLAGPPYYHFIVDNIFTVALSILFLVAGIVFIVLGKK